MDELLKNYISRQLRKKGKDYPLSEGSQLTAKGFGNLNKMVSKWYHAFKTINPWLTKRNTYNDLLARLQKLRKHNEQLTEEQKNQYTHANMLVGLRVN